MAELIIRGGQPLDGKTAIQGAKNSSLPILAACALTKDTCVLRNVPHLTDVDASAAILRHAGATVTRGPDALSVTAGSLTNADVPDELMQAMRSSVLFAGPLLGRTGRAAFSLPGGGRGRSTCTLRHLPRSARRSTCAAGTLSAAGSCAAARCGFPTRVSARRKTR